MMYKWQHIIIIACGSPTVFAFGGMVACGRLESQLANLVSSIQITSFEAISVNWLYFMLCEVSVVG